MSLAISAASSTLKIVSMLLPSSLSALAYLVLEWTLSCFMFYLEGVLPYICEYCSYSCFHSSYLPLMSLTAATLNGPTLQPLLMVTQPLSSLSWLLECVRQSLVTSPVTLDASLTSKIVSMPSLSWHSAPQSRVSKQLELLCCSDSGYRAILVGNLHALPARCMTDRLGLIYWEHELKLYIFTIYNHSDICIVN